MSHADGLVILGNHLFPIREVKKFSHLPVFMAEDRGLCTYVRHHQQKIVLFLAAMREHEQSLTTHGFQVCYRKLDDHQDESYESKLLDFVNDQKLSGLVHFEIEDHFFDLRMAQFCRQHSLKQTILLSPMFLSTRDQFSDYLEDSNRPFMATFYKRQRQDANILMNLDGSPRGGQWSFDQENRKKLPKSVHPPVIEPEPRTQHVKDVIKLVKKEFPDHPGDGGDFWWPVTRPAALDWLSRFLEQRIAGYGAYQDAISQRSDTVYHGVLSPMLNVGLITPRDVVDMTLDHAEKNDVPLNSLEGFIRQLIGWREFVRGIYHRYDEQQRNGNFWNHQRGLTKSWYTGKTGIPPLDDAIKTAMRLGWTHHILRLMVVGNIMNLAEIEPRQVHDWFMETHVDSSDWVMGPNVYGMALFSDGGLFATKPYICGSNYLLKMSDYSRGDWCDTVDGLYWRFIDKHRDFFAGNPRLSMMVRTLDRMKSDRREVIGRAADQFLQEHTAVP